MTLKNCTSKTSKNLSSSSSSSSCSCSCSSSTGSHIIGGAAAAIALVFAIVAEGQMVMLKYPYPRDIQEPDIYEPIRIHGQYSRTVVSCAQPHLAVSQPPCSLCH